MTQSKIKVILDADVIIHFSKGEMLSQLPKILPQYQFVVLSHVYDEVLPPIRRELDNIMDLLGSITLENFNPQGEMLREYAMLIRSRGKGESACMAYCKYNPNVLGSSNLKDIADYCKANGITYLTTVDFLYLAIKKGLVTQTEAEQFIDTVRSKGSRLPDVDFCKYVCSFQI